MQGPPSPASVLSDLPIRDGNNIARSTGDPADALSDLPIRDGNRIPVKILPLDRDFQTFLSGMETTNNFFLSSGSNNFQTFLSGMETSHWPAWLPLALGLSDLPIRDGNINRLFQGKAGGGAFRPSYQGWKRKTGSAFRMRRRSFRPSYQGWKPSSESATSTFPTCFQTFLSGMETCVIRL